VVTDSKGTPGLVHPSDSATPSAKHVQLFASVNDMRALIHAGHSAGSLQSPGVTRSGYQHRAAAAGPTQPGQHCSDLQQAQACRNSKHQQHFSDLRRGRCVFQGARSACQLAALAGTTQHEPDQRYTLQSGLRLQPGPRYPRLYVPAMLCAAAAGPERAVRAASTRTGLPKRAA
jgi:hypothetical protein